MVEFSCGYGLVTAPAAWTVTSTVYALDTTRKCLPQRPPPQKVGWRTSGWLNGTSLLAAAAPRTRAPATPCCSTSSTSRSRSRCCARCSRRSHTAGGLASSTGNTTPPHLAAHRSTSARLPSTAEASDVHFSATRYWRHAQNRAIRKLLETNSDRRPNRQGRKGENKRGSGVAVTGVLTGSERQRLPKLDCSVGCDQRDPHPLRTPDRAGDGVPSAGPRQPIHAPVRRPWPRRHSPRRCSRPAGRRSGRRGQPDRVASCSHRGRSKRSVCDESSVDGSQSQTGGQFFNPRDGRQARSSRRAFATTISVAPESAATAAHMDE